MGSYTARAVQGAVAVLVLSVASAGMAYLIRLVLAQTIPQADYGLFYAIFSLLGLLALFKDLGLNRAVAKFLPEALVERDLQTAKGIILTAFSIQFLVSGLVTLALILLAPWLAKHYFHAPQVAAPLILMALVFWLFPVENIIRFSFQGFQQPGAYALVDFLRMTGILAVVLALRGHLTTLMLPAWSYFLVYLLLPLVYIPLFLLRTFPQFFRTKARLSKALARTLVRFGLPTMLGVMGTVVMAYLDTLVLTYFRPPEEVALYQVASPTAKLLLYFAEAVSVVMFPLAAELYYRRRHADLRAGLWAAWKYSLIFILPAALLLISTPGSYLTLLFGPRYAGAADALQLLSAGAIVYTVAFLNTAILTAIGQPGVSTRIIGIAAALNLALNLALVRPFGLLGVAAATLASYLYILIHSTRKVREFLHTPYPWRQWTWLMVCGAAFWGFVMAARPWLPLPVLWREALLAVLAGALYLGLLFAVKILGPDDLRILRSFLRAPAKSQQRT